MNIDMFIIRIRFELINIDIIRILTRYKYDLLTRIITLIMMPYNTGTPEGVPCLSGLNFPQIFLASTALTGLPLLTWPFPIGWWLLVVTHLRISLLGMRCHYNGY